MRRASFLMQGGSIRVPTKNDPLRPGKPRAALCKIEKSLAIASEHVKEKWHGRPITPSAEVLTIRLKEVEQVVKVFSAKVD
jgi:hypothetical protein